MMITDRLLAPPKLTSVIRRSGFWMGAALLALCLVLSPLCGKSAQADTFTIHDFYVYSTNLWTNTGLWVDPGDLLIITAYGTIIYADPDAANMAGPDGREWPSTDLFIATDPSIPSHSLVGNIALDAGWVDGAGFFVGSSFTSGVPITGAREESGWLYLAFNDGVILTGRTGINNWGLTGDNSGYFVADITLIQGGAGPTPEPGTLVLLGSGLAGLVSWRRRRRKD